ncbi:MAG: ABC-2 family transporter protein [Thermoanaerobaculia bacterium]|nr:ABC-2 family transporter protein [Thermoanaerobaculia bacterium]
MAARLPGLQRGGHLRYLRLYLSFLRFSFSKALEFRVDFYFRVGMDGIYYVVNLAFFTVVYRHTTLLGGWDLDQIYVFVCGFLLVDAVHMTVFSNNLWWLPIYINRGDLDYYLTRPVSSLFFLSLREFAANSFLNVIIASGLMVWALARYPGGLPATRVALYLLLLAVGAFIYYLVRMLFIIPVFWLHSNRGLDEVSWSLTKLMERPHQIYRDWLRIGLLTVLPLALVVSLPAQMLFEGATPAMLLYLAATTCALAVVVQAFWRRGLAAYSSASS